MSKIIVGVDLSVESERAVAHAVAIGRHVGSELVLVMVDGVPDLSVNDRYTATLTARLNSHRRELADLRQRWIGHGVELQQLVVDGYADERLPALATELGADLIVVGSHGRTGLKRFFVGSVAEQVTRRAGQSVLIARGDAPDGGYRRALVGTDFSAPAEHAVARAVPLIARGGHLDLLHCWQLPWVGVYGEAVFVAPDDDLPGAYERALHELTSRLRATVLRQRPDLQLTAQLLPAPPAQGLVDTAAVREADLVAVGSHGRRGFRRFMLGSVAEVTIRHAPCSVLVVR